MAAARNRSAKVRARGRAPLIARVAERSSLPQMCAGWCSLRRFHGAGERCQDRRSRQQGLRAARADDPDRQP
eukprot:6464599-Prymnesium_polylepis.1